MYVGDALGKMSKSSLDENSNINAIFTGRGEGAVGLLGESKWLGIDEWALDEQMGGMPVSDEVCLDLVSTSGLLFCGESRSSPAADPQEANWWFL